MAERTGQRTSRDRERRVAAVLGVEGAFNVIALIAKLVVGFTTASAAVLSDAIHSAADLANNAVALVAIRMASAPPDQDHPYGHHKFETLAVFGLAILLCVLGFEIALRGGASEGEVVRQGWDLYVMLGVLVLNVTLATWEGWVAVRLNSDLLRADARHTLSDVLVTMAVIAGWQLAARGHAWADAVVAWFVAGLIFWLAYGLFRRAIPVLVDESQIPPDTLREVVDAIDGVRATRRIRSVGSGAGGRVDVVVAVDAHRTTAESHAIADAIEQAIASRFAIRDISVHVEPE